MSSPSIITGTIQKRRWNGVVLFRYNRDINERPWYHQVLLTHDAVELMPVEVQHHFRNLMKYGILLRVRDEAMENRDLKLFISIEGVEDLIPTSLRTTIWKDGPVYSVVLRRKPENDLESMTPSMLADISNPIELQDYLHAVQVQYVHQQTFNTAYARRQIMLMRLAIRNIIARLSELGVQVEPVVNIDTDIPPTDTIRRRVLLQPDTEAIV